MSYVKALFIFFLSVYMLNGFAAVASAGLYTRYTYYNATDGELTILSGTDIPNSTSVEKGRFINFPPVRTSLEVERAIQGQNPLTVTIKICASKNGQCIGSPKQLALHTVDIKAGIPNIIDKLAIAGTMHHFCLYARTGLNWSGISGLKC